AGWVGPKFKVVVVFSILPSGSPTWCSLFCCFITVDIYISNQLLILLAVGCQLSAFILFGFTDCFVMIFYCFISKIKTSSSAKHFIVLIYSCLIFQRIFLP